MIRSVILTIIPAVYSISLYCQSDNISSLSIHDIMKGEKFTGYSPSDIYWSYDSKKIYFNWNPDQKLLRSLYSYDIEEDTTHELTPQEQKALPAPSGSYNRSRSLVLYTKNGDLLLLNAKEGSIRQITNTLEQESQPVFSLDEKKVIYRKKNNLFTWDIESGVTVQLTDFQKGEEKKDPELSEQIRWLKKDQLQLFQELRNDIELKKAGEEQSEALKPDRPKTIFLGENSLSSIKASPNLRFITFITRAQSEGKATRVPRYVTEEGYLDIETARYKVGSPVSDYKMGIYDRNRDTVYYVDKNSIPDILKKPVYLKEYFSGDGTFNEYYDEPRKVIFNGPEFSEAGHAVIKIRSQDNKDRWIALMDLETGQLKLLEHQHDDAWIGGPGISGWNASAGNSGWIDGNRYWYQSEATGYSHLYVINVESGRKKALTKGDFEITDVKLSNDKKHFYLTTSKEDPGERHFYKMPVEGGKQTKITALPGNHDVSISPDEKYLSIRYSFSNRPWELILMENEPGAKAKFITDSRTPEFKSYDWRIPELVYFKAGDGINVRARIYTPDPGTKNGAGVIFVHGAGYLQNVHKWWSSYYREYMFHNLLVDNGYTVLDIDYRGSAGYGRDWRTAIYRHMGGKDLSDQVDGAKYLVEEHNLDPDRIGIYGGSYGGFITLMAMFLHSDIFACGAALRSVTDWAHYNHSYTSNILNTPATDSLAYRRSSPIYFAEGLDGPLLMLHGMVDSNVQFQDIVRLSQRLIELKKENWELSVFPVEGHGFDTESGWTDEYRRIFKLFQDNLIKDQE